MFLTDRIDALSELGNRLMESPKIQQSYSEAIAQNPWFTLENIDRALSSIQKNYLDNHLLSQWSSQYPIQDQSRKKVGLVLAGNIPLVGIHDIISVFISGHTSIIKYSNKDKVLLSNLIAELIDIEPEASDYFVDVDQLKNIDAVIATGGDTAATHFQYYFSKYPHIIRKNRSSIGIISIDDSEESLSGIGEDIFTYFGLGCRNISKLYLPKDFDIQILFKSIASYGDVIHHNKYKNNYDYSNAIYLLGKKEFLTNNFLIVREDEALSSRIACLHTERYDNEKRLVEELDLIKDDIQCFASSKPIQDLPFTRIGSCQNPQLTDYADRVDTLHFLTQLYD